MMLPLQPAKSLEIYGKRPSWVKPLISLLCLGIVSLAIWTKATSSHSIVNGLQLEDCTCLTGGFCQGPS